MVIASASETPRFDVARTSTTPQPPTTDDLVRAPERRSPYGYDGADVFIKNGASARTSTRKNAGVGRTLADSDVNGVKTKVTIEKVLGDPKGYANKQQAVAEAAGHGKAAAVFKEDGRWFAVGTNVAKGGLDETSGNTYRRTSRDFTGLTFVNLSRTNLSYTDELAKAKSARTSEARAEHWKNVAAIAFGVSPDEIHISTRKDGGDSIPGKINVAIHPDFPSNGQLVDTDSGDGGAPRLSKNGLPKAAVVMGMTAFRSDGGWKARETLMHESTHLENADRMRALYAEFMGSSKFKKGWDQATAFSKFQVWAYGRKDQIKGADEKVRYERDLALLPDYIGIGSGGVDESIAYAAAFMSSFHHDTDPSSTNALTALKNVGLESKGDLGKALRKDIATRLEAYYETLPAAHQRAMKNELSTNDDLKWVLPLWQS